MKDIIKIKIDEKSLFYGLKNDYKKGMTATVSTPINQSKYKEKWHYDIISLYDKGIELKRVPDILIDKCTKNTTSKAKTKIDYFFEFNNVFVDGKKLDVDTSFGMFIKREVDEYIINRQGNKVKNTHLNRQKLHYPISLKHTADGLHIDNKKILDTIMQLNGDFAFVVNGFEININDVSLNFLTSIIAPKDFPLSQVFLKKKGVGQKLLLNGIDYAAVGIPNKSGKHISTAANTEDEVVIRGASTNFEEVNKTKTRNGLTGERYVYDNIEQIMSQKCHDLFHTSLEYSTSPYDIEYIDDNGKKVYVEVKSTSSSNKSFYMSKYERRFMKKYIDSYFLILITNVNDQFPNWNKYSADQINKMRYEYETIHFYP